MVWAEMVMGRNGHGPKWLWAEMTSDLPAITPLSGTVTQSSLHEAKTKRFKSDFETLSVVSICIYIGEAVWKNIQTKHDERMIRKGL